MGRHLDRLVPSRRLAFVDLPGFGGSIGVPGPYDIAGHLERLEKVRQDHLPGEGLVVVGHSFGALLALAASAAWPEVAGALLIGLPAFASPAEARDHLRNLGPMEAWLATGAWQAKAACWVVCHARPLARLAAPFLAGDVPRAVARASVEHTWAAYDASFSSLVDDADVRRWLTRRTMPRIVLQGAGDQVCPPAVLQRVLEGTPVDVRVLDGDHHLPLHQPELCLQALEELLAETPGT